jgi:hypothetical protein
LLCIAFQNQRRQQTEWSAFECPHHLRAIHVPSWSVKQRYAITRFEHLHMLSRAESPISCPKSAFKCFNSHSNGQGKSDVYHSSLWCSFESNHSARINILLRHEIRAGLWIIGYRAFHKRWPTMFPKRLSGWLHHMNCSLSPRSDGASDSHVQTCGCAGIYLISGKFCCLTVWTTLSFHIKIWGRRSARNNQLFQSL